MLLLFAFEKLFLKILIFFFLISESKLRNLIYMANFMFAAGIILDENQELVLNYIIVEMCKRNCELLLDKTCPN